MSERIYAMTKIRPGSYLLPSNDAQTLWHIYRFEDGRSHGIDEPDRMWWACARYRGTFAQAQAAVMADLEAYEYVTQDGWEEYGSYYPTRAKAVDAALAAS